MNTAPDPRIALLQGGSRLWWDIDERRMVPATTVYVPFGCPDWGETKGLRNSLCTFCALPNSVSAYRAAFYGEEGIPDEDHVRLFGQTLRAAPQADRHTLMIFNAGSFLAMPARVQEEIMHAVVEGVAPKRIVIESRAPLITETALRSLLAILVPCGVKLTIRVGVESKDDHLRLKVLRKGHSRKQLVHASALMRDFGVNSGGYALLNPAPRLDPKWAEQEAIETIKWILDDGGLGMNEAYFGATCVGVTTMLAQSWREGTFVPATLRSVLRVLRSVLPEYADRIHLLPFSDEPEFLAVPSNHVEKGIPQSLAGAMGCDLAFHSMFASYRDTHNHHLLHDIRCSCNA
jgi:radical SAM enzyme (TIGR01210 family)